MGAVILKFILCLPFASTLKGPFFFVCLFGECLEELVGITKEDG